MRTIDPNEVYQRALKSPDGADALDEVELLIYALKELETYVAMQGWTGFFTGSCVYLYPNVRRCLELSDHARSLAILDDYVEYLSPGGGPLDANTIEGLASNRKSDGPSVPDWGEQFQSAAAERWLSLERYLASQGIRLMPPEESPETSDRVQSLAAELAALIERNAVKTKQGESIFGSEMLTLVCKRCGTTLQVAEPREPVCSPCRVAERAEGISSDVWAAVDPAIFANDIIRGMELIASLANVEFGDARDLFYARYRQLRATRASDFSCDHEAYWRGYYS